jgi:hypothetical protein
MREWPDGYFEDGVEVDELTRSAARIVEAHLDALREHAFEVAGALSGEELLEAAWDAERGSLWLRCGRGHTTLACSDRNAGRCVEMLTNGPVTMLVSAAGGNLLVTFRQGGEQTTVLGVPAAL